MSEIALVSSRKSKLEAQAKNGDTKAQQALNLAYRLTQPSLPGESITRNSHFTIKGSMLR